MPKYIIRVVDTTVYRSVPFDTVTDANVYIDKCREKDGDPDDAVTDDAFTNEDHQRTWDVEEWGE